jgi:cytochrome c553
MAVKSFRIERERAPLGRAGAGRYLLAVVSAVVPLMLPQSPAAADGLGYEGLPPQELCGLCHGLNGISATSKFPKLAGQRPAYIEKQLHDFLSGRRTNDGGQMSSIVTEITPENFAVAAAYFGDLPLPVGDSADVPLSPADVELAKSLFESGREESGLPACASCHQDTSDAAPHAPLLTSQHRDYLQKQLMDFKSGERTNDTTGTMQKVASLLDEAEIAALAAFLSTTPRAR